MVDNGMASLIPEYIWSVLNVLVERLTGYIKDSTRSQFSW